MYTLDTNAIIYYLKDDLDAMIALHPIFSDSDLIYLSAISELELFSFSHITAKEAKQIENILSTLKIISVDSEVARLAGSLRREFRLKTADSAVAATALKTNSTLITRNISDFQKVKKLKLLEL
ncbi:MAG: hypothetical protein A2074_06330 [Candidatus Aquicultor primus]|uniref:PIN domain-containing protein n=1 Tax=Candidatus Aquicultor primus TaxID=1797195 RepID=A0A1F2USM3_9ACTN|nr:MAG: hypothetical protein A2074_06330 [Candidatus Aquicultor primus]